MTAAGYLDLAGGCSAVALAAMVACAVAAVCSRVIATRFAMALAAWMTLWALGLALYGAVVT